MPVSKVQLTGGNFQDAEGNLLSGGYLTFVLNQDGVVNTSQICAGIKVTVNLDGYGSVIAGQYVWGNDQLSPVNSYYKVTGYKANGQSAFGPNNQQVLGNGGTFDVGTWVPNLVTSWTPALQPLSLQTNEVANGNQFLLDLQAGTGISLADNGSGRVTITGSVGLSLETKGVANGSQTLLNLAQGNGMTLTDNGTGTVTIAGLSLEVNGTPNASQVLLNLAEGAGLSATDNGSGTVTFTNRAAAIQFAVPDWVNMVGTAATAQWMESPSNGTYIWKVIGINTGGSGALSSVIQPTTTVAQYAKIAVQQTGVNQYFAAIGSSFVGTYLGFVKIFKTNVAIFSTTSVRYWIGMSNKLSGSLGTVFESNNPVANIVGFRYVAGTDTHWMAYCSTDGTNFSTHDTGVTPDTTGALHTFSFSAAQGVPGTINFSIDGVSVGQITTHVPAGTVLLAPVAYVEGLTNVSPSIGINHFFAEYFQ